MYIIPFTEDSVKEEICGKSMMIRIRPVGSPMSLTPLEFELKDDGSNWEIEDGVLLLKDERKTTMYIINGAEVVKGSLFLSGEALRTAGKREQIRMVMYEKLSLGDKFHVVVSSHVSYEEKTLPRLIRSLAREGIPAERVTVVVGSCKDQETSEEKGYTRVPVEENFLGCTAFAHILRDDFTTDADYVLLLHDTCEAVPGFIDAIGSVDVGMPFDVIRASNEIGLWSVDFLEKLKTINGLNIGLFPAYEIADALCDMSCLMTKLLAPKMLKSKDVYGGGVERSVLEISELGIKKYVAKDMTGGRP